MTLVAPKTVVLSTIHRKIPVNSSSVILPSSPNCYAQSEMECVDVQRKRKRLTHLSPEDRMLRRKLKNRVAAQTARDRKKQKMDDLELALASLEAENKKLQEENLHLHDKTDKLLQENVEMKERLGFKDSSVTMVTGHAPSESAALASPLQQERARTLVNLTTHCLAFLMTLSLTHSLDCSSKSQNSLIPQLKTKLKRLQHSPLRHHLSPKLVSHLKGKWWGPQQKSWNPSKN